MHTQTKLVDVALFNKESQAQLSVTTSQRVNMNSSNKSVMQTERIGKNIVTKQKFITVTHIDRSS